MSKVQDAQKRIDKLQGDQERATVELRNVSGGLQEAKARRQQLWADADVEGKDTTAAVAKLSKQIAEREEQVERLQAGIARRTELMARATEELHVARRAEGQDEARKLTKAYTNAREKYITVLRLAGGLHDDLIATEQEIARLVQEYGAEGLHPGVVIPAIGVDLAAHATMLERRPAEMERQHLEYLEQRRREQRMLELRSDPEYHRLLSVANATIDGTGENPDQVEARRKIEKMVAG